MWARRLGWFAGIWALSIAALAIVSLLLKIVIGH
jgi:uncharacterized protein DUF2474